MDNDTKSQPGYVDHKKQYANRLRRIEGQVRGLQRMVDEDTYCIDVLTQIAAVNKALQAVAVGLLEQHIRHCVAAAVESGGDALDEKASEAARAVERLLKA